VIQNGQTSGEFQIVVFTVAGTEFGIPISVVREIIAAGNVVALPDMPQAMVGILNVRGNVLPVIDLRSKFGMGSGKAVGANSNKILLVELNESTVGFLVDAVSEVLSVSESHLEYLTQIHGLQSGLVGSICKLGDRLIPIVAVEKLLTFQETKQLENVSKERVTCSAI